MNLIGHKQQRGASLQPLDEIEGFWVRPGFYNTAGAVRTARGVSFTIYSDRGRMSRLRS